MKKNSENVSANETQHSLLVWRFCDENEWHKKNRDLWQKKY